ncbi:PREDICTED: DNA replication ATP-dependent helicase/nuclease DNA2 [Ceratosolen solmsi marchali]|uniref:DNA replication ATP-dependent helicase/nuclease n=1 Tax=Ceratosolen solmsi marchali TaxID=326594 RepID=A0AAJ7DV19_9HYME|nr:PREDICTED: DNA replication ATP-dependent helicase/nuclease DNA2 [Ceratosolen solmsi marchali]
MNCIEKPSKIRKLSNSNISFANVENKNDQEVETKIRESLVKESSQKTSSVSSSSNIELNRKNKCISISDDSGNTDNILNSQATDTLEGLDDLFEEDWSYKRDTLDDLDDLFQDEWCYENESTIDFSTPKRCIIIDIISDTSSTTLSVKNTNDETLAIVKCFGVWHYTKIEPGEIIVIKAKKESIKEKYWIVDNNFGWIINQPDTLISGTTVVGALFCNRRSIFQEKFRLLENLPYYEGGNNLMLIGSLTHELLQMVLDKDIKDMKSISGLLNEILKSKNAIYMMYSAGISTSDCKNLMRPAVAQIYKFIQQYITGNRSEIIGAQNFDGKIEKICDIEETVWMPTLGLKGKIDLTVEVSKKSTNKSCPNVERRILPLELKTGKVSFSNEHQGQLILYAMLMDMTGRKTDSGLLLYLKENIMREITGSVHVRRDLITLRNTVAYYSTRQPTIVKIKNKETILPMELPKPIDHTACTQCPYNVLCCTYLMKEDKKVLHDNHPLKILDNEISSYLSEEHTEYVMKWISLLQLEESLDNRDIVSWKDVWTIKPSKREKNGSCISNLNLIFVSENDGRFLHKFQRIENYEKVSKINTSDFNEQDYVIISTNNRINVCSGFINKVTPSAVLVYCEKDISKVYNDSIFHIDKSLSSSLLTFNMSQLGGLLNNHSICTKLRKIVIERQPATFNSETSDLIMKVGKDIFKKLNEDQKQAILKTLAANDYLLIKGFPGTGKTETIVAIIELFVRLNKSVLVTAHTNNAVDNILLKLLERKIDFVRFGSSNKINPALIHMLDDNITENCNSPEDLHNVYCSKKVIGLTCYGTSHPHLSKRIFDICIVDESTQVLQPTILGPLYCASKFILVGDPEQLPPIAKSVTARKLGMNESLFFRLNSENNTISLLLQYRMNKCIMNTANKLTYNNQLRIGNEIIGNATLPVTNKAEFKSCERWVRKALSLELGNSTIFLNTSATYNLAIDLKHTEYKGICNYWEAAIIIRLINVLKNLGIDNKTIGIITPYRAQVRLLRAVLLNDIEINTVDQYQGRAKSVVIYSCTKSISTDMEIPEYDILEDHQRLTVAVTRAKHKLIIIGDLNTLQRYTPFNKLFAALRKCEQIYDLRDGMDNFCFNDLIKLLD